MSETAGTPRVRGFLGNRVTLWTAFVLAHLWLGMLGLYATGDSLGDVSVVYKGWTDQVVYAGFWPGIDTSWVYPVLAMVPMLAARALGPALYTSTWLSLVMLLNAVAFAAITGWFASRYRAAVAWWWIAFLVLLGPIALGRIDAVTVPVAMVGVLLLAARPTAAAVLLALATWIKVWPAALIAAILIASRRRGEVFAAVIGTTVAIVVIAVAFGSGTNVFSFITEQTGRGLQVEAPVTIPWLWLAVARVPGVSVYYDTDILTFQVTGDNVDLVAALMTPVLAVVALAVAAVGVWAVRRGARAAGLLAPLALALVTALIVFNKVGSPQFIAWLAVPVVLGLAARTAGLGGSFRVPAVLALVLAALTQLVYPLFYSALLSAVPAMVLVITVRNLLLVVLLVWAVRAVVLEGLRAARATRDNEYGHDDDADRAHAWPSPPAHSSGPADTTPLSKD
ncbi:hypothetical protein HD599_000897 [Conyzicola lurida]|uniref:DUF2029 domain-containing protein n=1 Tax=Conyzicola lurida TaxID=1172621 RepID=A0A841AJG9_9MICO|nr:glycosyltransferase 87 family protein [Conyzicola lurida]MBB5842574.1 hypothetical protein [Conyzicola lurida]